MNNLKAILKAATLGAAALLLTAGVSFAQQQVNLTAAPTTTTMPDGTVVPMWGYTCVGPTVIASSTATCLPLNPNAPVAVPATLTTPAVPGWSPVVITVPTGQALTINLTNSLSFTAGTGTNTVPTSIMIVGQIGGGLGVLAQRTTTTSPDHSALASNTVSWPIAGSPGAFTPPTQLPRVQSFGTEVVAGATTALTFGTSAFPLKPGTYLIMSGTHPSIQGPMGLYGILVVTCGPTATAACTATAPAGTAYPAVTATATTPAVPAVTYNAEVPVEFSEIDPVQNNSVQAAVTTAGFSETMVWSGQPGGCGNPSSTTYHQCYPPAVNYTPLYYTINGVAFNKTNAGISVFQALPAGVTAGTGTVLVRMVNAGSRMHVPAIVGSQTGTAVAPATVPPTGFSLMAEDGNVLPGLPRVQSEVFMAAGKVYDVMINAPAATSAALAVYDRELSLSSNAVGRDSGMLAYIGVNGSGLPAVSSAAGGAFAPAVANPDSYVSLAPCTTAPCIPLTVSDPSKGVIANDVNVYGVTLLTAPTAGTLTLNANGTFTYVPNAGTISDSFVYCANGSVTGTGATAVCSSNLTATASLGAATNVGGITCPASAFTASMATYLAIKTPGVLSGCTDSANLPLTVVTSSAPTSFGGGTLLVDANGGFTASVASAGVYTFAFTAKNSLGKTGAGSATVTFPAGSGLSVKVVDGKDKTTAITDYRWIIEEDRTFYIDPNCTTTTATPAAGCPSQTSTNGVSPVLGVNFHTDYMPYVAQGCTGAYSCEGGQTVVDPATGLHNAAVCDIGNGVCRPDPTGNGFTAVDPSQVHLDPSKRYYISVLPGDAANPFSGGAVGHGQGGAPIAAACKPVAPATTCATGTFAPVTVLSQPAPYPTGKYSVMVFEDDFPLNGEIDTGGGIGTVNSANEQGLGGFQIHLWDSMAKFGDFTGQMSYDMFNQPLTNSLAGSIDPISGVDACPVSTNSRIGTIPDPKNPGKFILDPTQTGKTGMVVTCPTFEADGVTPSPLAGQAVIDNLMPGQWAGIATPGADRIARGEEWLQTNTLDGQKGHDVFTRIEEPSFFQEYGPAGFHNAIGFANPKIINGRKAGVCTGQDPNLPGTGNCNNTLTGKVTGERLSRTPDERLYSSGSRDAFYWTQCYVSFGDPDGEDFAFTKCNADGTFTLTGLPAGNWRITTFDEWNDQLVDGLSTPVRLGSATNASCPGSGSSTSICNVGDIATTQWQINLYTRTFIDDNKDGISQAGEAGIPLINTAVRLRDGQLYNNLGTDFNGIANFNETFPLFNWYTVETDTTRYKSTGTHVVYDVGGPADGSASCGVTGYPPCGNSVIGKFLANTAEVVSVPTNLRIPGAVYCKDADCSTHPTGILGGPGTSDPPSSCTTSTTGVTTCSTTLSSGRIDPPWVGVEGWQGFSGQNNFLEFGKEPYATGENGGIHGHVVYASTRPFDDPMMLVQTQWTPLVPNVTINLYQEGFASDRVTPTLKLVDTTKTSSWDDWAQGFRPDGTPNMSCPGQGAATGPIPDLFYYSLYNQPNYLDWYNNVEHGTAASPTVLPSNSQFKCYDGMHNWNQLQPAPYDGMYKFPSVTATDANGKPTLAGTNCTICVPNTFVPTTDLYYGIPQLPAGKYVAEVVVPPGYELVKEEDKNILIGDNFIAPVTQEFGGLGNIFILPDQASVAATVWDSGPGYNANNAQNQTQSLGAVPENGIVPGFVPEPIWPCVGEARIVPDYMSIYPQAHEVAAFAGATRNLCDRKEVTLGDQMGAIAKFFIYTSTHTAAKFTGIITDDYTSEFDPFAPTFGEKFSPPDMPVSFKDWGGNEISRVYSDHWGTYNGMTYSSWEVNPPNPTGYSPTMMVVCMNDPGPITDTLVGSPTFGQQITDPLFNPAYSQFCYELPFMPGTTAYEDTPVVPTSAFAGAGYNNPDCAYPALTPSISEVDSSDGIGPWVSASGSGHTLTITSLGDQMVPNYGYTGPAATTAPYNQKTISRHYGFSPTGALNATGAVTIGGVTAPISSWSDTQIVVTVPSGVPPCPVQQQAQYGGSAAQCGELVITTSAARTGGNVTGVTITRGGSYNTAPTVTFGAAPAGGTRATGTANLGGSGVASVAVTNGGSGFTSVPGVTFTGGTGTGAAGTAVRRRKVTSVTITGSPAGGTYPGAAPTVTFGCTGCGGGGGVTNATGTALLTTTTPHRVASVTINTPGSYPLTGTITVTFSGGGTGHVNATGTTVSTGFISAVTVTAPGSGYTTPPTVTIGPVGATGGGSGATATAALATTHSVTSVTITNPGSGYTTTPTVTFSGGVGGGTSTATGTAAINGPSVLTSGKQSVDTVTVTIGGKGPTHVAPSASIQATIDAAAPGDMIIVDPTCTTTAGVAATCTIPTTTNLHSTAAHNEMLIMWKPVRLQGVGSRTSIINANTQPAGKLNVWREQVNCLFGLGLNGSPINSAANVNNSHVNSFDPTGAASCPGTGWNYFTTFDENGSVNPQIDRLPLESVVGWIADLNGNLAELLQEPSLMGALEGAGITVLSKGVNFPSDPYNATLLAGFPVGTTLLQNTMANPDGALCDVTPNPFPSNYSCNPSSIDGLGIMDSSQGGGAIFVHGWGHNLQIGNNWIHNNAGTLSGGVNVGQGEYPPAYIQGSATNAAPGSCEESPVPNAVLPYCQNVNVNVHNNNITLNMSTGDELFSSTPAGNGGASFCTGSDYYKFNYNWLCGNMSSGDGGGFGHIGFSYNGDIEHNSILFNQSLNPTIPTNGGGIMIMGAPDADPICSTINPNLDLDCLPNPANSVGPSDGAGPGLVINANLIMGNAAEAGSGGGIAFMQVNGSDVVAFPANPKQWNTVTVTNNIIADNVAGWDGAGISLADSLAVNIINNTIVSNSSTATSGVLFNTIGAPLASQPGSNCTTTSTTSCPQPGGLVTIQNGAVLSANIAPLTVICPPGHFTDTATNGNCRRLSVPKLENNIIWQNSSYYIGVLGVNAAFQQNVVSLYNSFGSTLAPSQATTGQCVARSYWDIGVRGDTGPNDHSSGVTLAASDSVLTAGGSSVTGSGNSSGAPSFISQYCDGSRTPPEFKASGWQVPPGISDAIVPNPIFSLSPIATVDEGNNWINMSWGPLSLVNPVTNVVLGNYGITAATSARVTGANFTDAPAYDFFDTPRKTGGSTDAGAVRLTSAGGSSEFTLSPSFVDFGLVPAHSPTTLDQDVQVINSGSAPVTFVPGYNGTITGANQASFSIQPSPGSTCAGTTLGAGQSCVINVVFNPTSSSQAVRNGTLSVNVGGITQTVTLTGHDTIATVSVSAITPALTATPANTAAVTGTITVTNTMPLTNPDAGPYLPTAITLSPLTNTGTFALGGTCAVGTPINAGGTVPPTATPVAGSSCTITITYTPPAGATGTALNGRVNLLVTGYGTASTNPIINANFNAN